MTEEVGAERKTVVIRERFMSKDSSSTTTWNAREAAEIACDAAARMEPARSKTIDNDWTEHPDRADQSSCRCS